VIFDTTKGERSGAQTPLALIPERGMWTRAVVFDAPGGDLPACVEQMPEPTYIQTLIPQPAVETFHVRILGGLAWLDMNGIDPPLDVPSQEMLRTHFRTIVASNRYRRTSQSGRASRSPLPPRQCLAAIGEQYGKGAEWFS